LGQEAVFPLAVEEVVQLLDGAGLVVVGVADSDKRRIPRPLVRVEPGTRLRVTPGPVEVQNHFCPPGESRIFLRHHGRLLRLCLA